MADYDDYNDYDEYYAYDDYGQDDDGEPVPIAPGAGRDHNGYSVQYVGEGAANVVVDWLRSDSTNGGMCQPHPCYSGDHADLVSGRLLRMPKAGTSAFSYQELQDYWENKIVPLFKLGDLVIQQYGPEYVPNKLLLAKDINDLLERLDQEGRRGSFRGSRVIVGAKPMQLRDMRAENIFDLACEFKPKWLVQSPSAPGNAIRCRNCAHEAYKLHKAGEAGPATKLCPFKYVGRPSDLEEALEDILQRMRMQPAQTFLENNNTHVRRRLGEWLHGDNVLKRLRMRQLQNDFKGPLHAEDDDVAFHLAMTLRDCSCYLRLPHYPLARLEARLGDLDKKNAESKMEYWRSTERTLIEGGFYEGTEQPHVVTNCVYGRS
jgi:inositol-pentakisphosphate 2-kinase